MNLLTSMDISSAGLTAQRIRMNIISENLANVNTTRTPQGGPYVRKAVVFQSEPVESFQNMLQSDPDSGVQTVKVPVVVEDNRDPKEEFNPGHPDANAQGIVLLPNINPVEEMVNLMMTSRTFEANITAFNAAKSMALRALEIGK
jgi:flagellar basal-body rod protein FlgC